MFEEQGQSSDTAAKVAPEWKQKAAAKRKLQYHTIPEEWRLKDPLPQPKNAYEYLTTSGVLTPAELEITETTDATVLLRKMATGQLSAVEVTKAYSKRAAIAQQLIRCCTEMFFDEAIETAKKLDEYLTKNGKTIGPLHGLPLSLKDCFNVTGQDTTVGWVCDIGNPAKADDIIVEILRSQGAVLYVKTNVPQSLMMSDSYNHIFKQSVNAFHNALISGGSSGGEGALVGCRGSLVGIGTDIGGSVRIPANLQGLYGLCPTVGRIPWDKSGLRDYIVSPVAGPIASKLSTIEVFMDSVLHAEPWRSDPTAVPMPWRHDIAAKPTTSLKIGYYLDDGVVRVQPPLQAAVRKAIAALSRAGHEVFSWDTSEHELAYDLWLKAVLADGGRRCRLQCQRTGEPLVEGMLVGKPEDELSVVEADELSGKIRAYQKQYLTRLRESGVDALIMPTQPYVGFKPKTWVKSSQYVGYTAHWNLVNFAALSMPVSITDDELAQEYGGDISSWKDHKPRNESDRFNWEQYDPALVGGMPVCIQIVGGRFGEEKMVSVAKAVEEALQSLTHS